MLHTEPATRATQLETLEAEQEKEKQRIHELQNQVKEMQQRVSVIIYVYAQID